LRQRRKPRNQRLAIDAQSRGSAGYLGKGIAGEARQSRAGLGDLGRQRAAAIVDLGAQLRGLERLRGPRRARGEPRRDGRLEIVEALDQEIELREAALGVVEIDPGQRGFDPDILCFERKACFGHPEIGSGARDARAALAPVGKFLFDPDPGHGHAVAAEAECRRARDGEVLDPYAEGRVGQLASRDRRRTLGIDPGFAGKDGRRIARSPLDRSIERQRIRQRRDGNCHHKRQHDVFFHRNLQSGDRPPDARRWSAGDAAPAKR
jgi:hypothetical protein